MTHNLASPEPTVTVIIPAFNAACYILGAIRSVLDQGGRTEIVLVDDGSTDDTCELVRSEAPGVRIVRQPNAGVAAARNTGLREARGDLICFLDADDGWFPGKLAVQQRYLARHPEVCAVYHNWLVWNPETSNDGVSPRPPDVRANDDADDPAHSGWLYTQLLLDCIIHTSTIMLRRDAVLRVGDFDPALVTGEDYDYWLRLSQAGVIHKLAGTYSYYRMSSGSLTASPKAQNNEYVVVTRALAKWGDRSPDGTRVSPGLLRERLSQLAFDFGYEHYHRGSRQTARTAFATALRHRPLNWRAAAYLAASIMRPHASSH